MNLEPCDPVATEIDVGTPVDGETETRDQPPGDADFYCLAIPDGLTGVTVTLSGLADDLDLYVGHPDLETVKSGGFDFWFSDEDGTTDEVVTVPPRVSTGFVVPGRYYIEVSGGFAGSPYTLLVETRAG
jgi:hypothetical protein